MIIVPALLEKGDVFLMDNVMYFAIDVDDDRVCYVHKSGGKTKKQSSLKRIGRHSKKKIILIEDCDFGDVNNLGKNIVTKSSQ